MAMKIRLARGGSKKRPFYSIVTADSRIPRDGQFIEKLGTYNPLLPKDSEDRIKMDLDRVKHWLDQGAQVAGFRGLVVDCAAVHQPGQRQWKHEQAGDDHQRDSGRKLARHSVSDSLRRPPAR
mgnify:CR=1 FL=1